MSRRNHVIATLILFVVFAAYGYQALQIPLFPGQEDEPFKPRTMPVALALVGLLLTGIRAAKLAGSTGQSEPKRLGTLHWQPVKCLVKTN